MMDSVTITELFDDFLEGVKGHDEHTRSLVGVVKKHFTDNAIQGMRRHLSEIAKRADCAAHPIVVLREAIMDEVDTIVLREEFLKVPAPDRQKLLAELKNRHEDRRELYTDEALAVLGARSEVVYRVLRLYARRTYDDVAEDDWFAFYSNACRWKNAAMLKVIRQRVIEGAPGVKAELYKALRDTWPIIRQFALKAAPKEKILRRDERVEQKIKELLNIKTDEAES